MKSLTLLRHAKSAWDDPVMRDIARPLNARGRRAARTVGKSMRTSGLRFDRVIASPATRVVETLEDIALGYGRALSPCYDQRLYLASPESLLEIIHETGDDVARLLLVGHNPGLEQLALLLTDQRDAGFRASLVEKYPTGALAEISLRADRWNDVREGSGTLVRFVRPRDLDPELGPED